MDDLAYYQAEAHYNAENVYRKVPEQYCRDVTNEQGSSFQFSQVT